MNRRALIEWLLMAILLPPIMLWLGHQASLTQADFALYDRLVYFDTHEPSPDILLIGIDDRSIRELGDWPWPRRLHAKLLDRLSTYAPRAVLLDLFLDRASPDPEDDKQLAAAMLRLPVFLPLAHPESFDTAIIQNNFVAPLTLFANNAKGVGHVDITPDIDGIARRFFRWEGPTSELQPYVGWLITSQNPLQLPRPPASNSTNDWQKKIPFGFQLAGPAGTYRMVSYTSVLHGEVPPELLRGKILLIGAVTNSGLGDELPIAGIGLQMHMSGIELNANAIDALWQGHTIIFAQGWRLIIWTALPIWIVLALFLRAARGALAISVGVAILWMLLSFVGLIWQHVWYPPTASVLGVAVTYLLWSWRRLNSLLVFFQERINQLNAIPAGVFEPALRALSPTLDTVENQAQALDRAIDRVTQMQALLTEGLWQMPVAILVCNDDGDIDQSNAAAQMLLASEDTKPIIAYDPLRGENLLSLLKKMTKVIGADPDQTDHQFHWSQALIAEYSTQDGKTFKLRTALLDRGKISSPAWLVVLRDLTVERLAQKKREQWLSFVSHDLRSPQVSILSLLALYKQSDPNSIEAQLVENIRREAQRTLMLTESFMDLAEAESDNYHFIETEAGAIVLDAINQAWPYAKVRGVTLLRTLGESDCHIYADPTMLTRALVNLLNNAIRHSPIGSTVKFCLNTDTDSTEAILSISDNGEGMSATKLTQLMTNSNANVGSAIEYIPQAARNRGLGFSVVRAVISRHNGSIDAFSAPQEGTTFLITLPLQG